MNFTCSFSIFVGKLLLPLAIITTANVYLLLLTFLAGDGVILLETHEHLYQKIIKVTLEKFFN